MSWQACPKCKGIGTFTKFPLTSYQNEEPCPVCKGAMIINEITGLPPSAFGARAPVDTKNI